MIIVTGGAGFIGSAFVSNLNAQGRTDIIVVDRLGVSESWRNLKRLTFEDFVQRDEFITQVRSNSLPWKIEAVVHMGASSATTERDGDFLLANNYHYTKTLAEYCLNNQIRFIYASSGQVYGDGRFGYVDDDQTLLKSVPITRYGWTKHMFDSWVIRHNLSSKVVGLRFFNVYGPNEYHKGDQRSVIHKAYHEIKTSGKISLFKSYHPDYKDGESLRDFVYIKDCCTVMAWFLNNPKANGIFNVGSGKAHKWNDLARAMFKALKLPEKIEYREMPEELRGQYQYFTEASIEKLIACGAPPCSTALEDGIADYITNYLETSDPYL